MEKVKEDGGIWKTTQREKQYTTFSNFMDFFTKELGKYTPHIFYKKKCQKKFRT